MSRNPTPSIIDASELAAFNKAAGDPLRLQILRVLAQDSYGVLELCDIFKHKQSGMSHHLKVLASVGLVAKRREGNSIFYYRALPDISLAPLQQQLYATVDQLVLPEAVQTCLAEVASERIKLSQQFFEQQADKFKEQQDLIAEYPAYGDAVGQMLETANGVGSELAIEIGPGAGEFLPQLAHIFDQVVALDNAAAMLEQAGETCQKEQLSNVQLIHGDTLHLYERQSAADCVVMNMVLHHTPSPADIFLDVAQCLKKGGVFIVTDLCRHDQDWARSACGDIWLGFDSEELQRWAKLAALQQGHSKYLALRNGFQIQVQQFVKE